MARQPDESTKTGCNLPSAAPDERRYRVIVPCPDRPKDVSYPPSGHPLYTRQEAIDLLKKFQAGGRTGDLAPWAGSATERFDLTMVDSMSKRRRSPMINAKAWSDDHNIEVEFDATAWFEGASNKEILELAACGWRGDYPADAVAIFMAEHVPEWADLFKYLQIIAKDPLKKDLGGFECAVSAEQARQWIKKHRPSILAMALDAVGKGELDAATAAQRIPSQKYEVRLVRTESRYLRIEVEADTERHARCVALDKAGDLDFFSGTAGKPTYDIDEIEEVKT